MTPPKPILGKNSEFPGIIKPLFIFKLILNENGTSGISESCTLSHELADRNIIIKKNKYFLLFETNFFIFCIFTGNRKNRYLLFVIRIENG